MGFDSDDMKPPISTASNPKHKFRVPEFIERSNPPVGPEQVLENTVRLPRK
jgi:hypothetical protein